MERVRTLRYGTTNVPKKITTYTPEKAMFYYIDKLTAFERKEIFLYPVIYYLGLHAQKHQTGVSVGPHNCGYDDHNGFYKLVKYDHIAYRYEVKETLGKGTFGQVVKAYDHKLHKYVAIKMVRNDKGFYRQAVEEVKLLQKIKEIDVENKLNVVHILESFTFRNHMCMTFELLGKNLYDEIAKNHHQGFTMSVVAKMAFDILQCLEGLQKNNITHCDLKPENIVLKEAGSSGIKVIDFGSSMFDLQDFYPYIQTRYYRAPEVMLGSQYGMPIDMWSFGCILVELLTGHPLFPGENAADQMACIMEVLGTPPPELLQSSTRVGDFFSSEGVPLYCQNIRYRDGSRVLRNGYSPRGKFRGTPASRSLLSTLKGRSDLLFLNFLKRCLEWDPARRMTPSEALCHPWLRRHLPKPTRGETRPKTCTAEYRAARTAVKCLPSSLYCHPNGLDRKYEPKYTSYKVRYR
ncbi:dual specificity tyrosine-phosphorylation-regulated kinase 2-like [Rhinophrynus dorsalis]